MITARQASRNSRLRALKAYGLRAKGLKLKEIAPHLGRRDRGLWTNLDFRDKPVTNERVRSMVNKGRRIVIHWHNARRRPMPKGLK